MHRFNETVVRKTVLRKLKHSLDSKYHQQVCTSPVSVMQIFINEAQFAVTPSVTEISSCFSVIHRASRGHAIFFPGFVSVSVQSALSLSINPAQFQLMNCNNLLIIEALINFVP